MKLEMDVRKLWFDNSRIYIETADGQSFSQPLAFYPRLKRATPEQLTDYRFSYSGIHWDKIDEDVSFESFTWPDDDQDSLIYTLHQDSSPEVSVQTL